MPSNSRFEFYRAVFQRRTTNCELYNLPAGTNRLGISRHRSAAMKTAVAQRLRQIGRFNAAGPRVGVLSCTTVPSRW
jgi:hypothetical protein